MGITKRMSRQIADLSQQLINAMGVVEGAAKAALMGRVSLNASEVLVTGQKPILGFDLATQKLEEISYARRMDISRISGEPFVAYVLAKDDRGAQSGFFFARGTVFEGLERLDGQLVSYRAPLGRLAEHEPGEDLTVKLPYGLQRNYTILRRVRLYPYKEPRGWDGKDDKIEAFDIFVEIKSLLDFLAELGTEVVPEDYYGKLLKEADTARLIKEGARRGVIDRMSLRDQPILDRYQGEVFRLPLNRRLFLCGAPGTGKTTTLIRRLAQKRNADDVSEEELDSVPLGQHAKYFHPNNWLMFTPTELLRLYLKEAFAKEGIASPDERIRTWTEHRRQIARNVFRILRSERGGRFILDEEGENIQETGSKSLIALFEDFSAYFQSYLVRRYKETFQALGHDEDETLVGIFKEMLPSGPGGALDFGDLFGFVAFHDVFRGHMQRLSEECKRDFRVVFNQIFQKKRELVADLEVFFRSMIPTFENPEDEEDEDSVEDEEESLGESDGQLAAIDALRKAIFARARSVFENRTISRTSRNARILEWLSERYAEELDLKALGGKLSKLRRVRFLAGTHRNIMALVPSVYNRFRLTRFREGRWYRTDATASISRGRINGLELDVMLLEMLKNGRKYLSQSGAHMLQEDTRIAMLESLKGEYVTQVLIDEVTDFSPIQVACMAELADPKFRSCFMCGDIHQRVTRWGISKVSEFKWIADDCETKEVTIGYRMSGNLINLAYAVASIGEEEKPKLKVPPGIESPDIRPLLGEGLSGRALGRWLCDRICEIERNIGTVPSIAIFVENDDKIDALLEYFKPIMAEHNLEVIGCKEGQSIGTESRIRVFDVQYVKGLEFEAVFFIGVDGLVKKFPGLFDKLLFVGITRAATYLGLTSHGKLPGELDSLRPHLSTSKW